MKTKAQENVPICKKKDNSTQLNYITVRFVGVVVAAGRLFYYVVAIPF